MCSIQSYFRSLYLIYWFILVVLAGSLAYMIWEIEPYREDEYDEFALFIEAGIGVIAFILGRIMLGKKIALARSRRGMAEKLGYYKSGFVKFWAILALPTIAAIIGYFFTGDHNFVYITLGCLAVILLYMPSKWRTIHNLKLAEDEVAMLQNPDSAL